MSEEDKVNDIPDNTNDSDDSSDKGRQMSIKPIADIEEVPTTIET